MENEKPKTDGNEELQESWWYKVYAAVILNTIVVIFLLWAFSNYFSN
ncbi:MAG: hypothetical protein R2681_06910 [Pyrinomonadaceae bacterium]